jgi:hypothetical protein
MTNKIIHTPEDDESRGIPAIFPGSSQRLAVGSSSVQSTSMGETTGLVRLSASTDCYIAFGTNPTATNASLYLPAGMVEYIGINPGEKIAVLQVSAAGFLNIVEAL